jgi:transcriptional regulator with XRE-family HTH domain
MGKIRESLMKDARRACRLTQAAVATQLGELLKRRVEVYEVSRWERGDHLLAPEVAFAHSLVYGRSLSQLGLAPAGFRRMDSLTKNPETAVTAASLVHSLTTDISQGPAPDAATGPVRRLKHFCAQPHPILFALELLDGQ